MSTLIDLLNYGQSYWLDNLTRQKIKGGELKKRVQNEGLRGITSNPAIFNKAISNSDDYDAQIKKLVKENKSVHEIYEELTVKDVQDACGILRPVYDDSDGVDGFVSLEVSPYLAHNPEGSLEEARRLFSKVDRPNCFIKIPGTTLGVPVIEQLLYEGININITLLFSIKNYEDVAHAYIRALKKRNDEGKDISKLRSVASFFLSRIDVLTDQILGHMIVPEQNSGDKPRPENLLGKTAIANAKLAYQSYKKIFSGEEWENLIKKGAKVQRPLWASTSTKDPLYRDTRYVETLIGPDTVNTLPDKTIKAFADHGILEENTVGKNLDWAKQVFEDLERLDININFITDQLINEGVQKFIDPYDNLMKTISEKREKFLAESAGSQEIKFGENESDVKDVFESLDEKQFTRRLFAKDPYLWKDDPNQVEEIRIRMGWLDSAEDFLKESDDILNFVKEIKKAKYNKIVLLGMGGSSLCPEVASETFKSKQGFPELIVLDNTSPEAVLDVEKKIDYNKTLFIVASKSGTTTETLSFYRYFYEKMKETAGDNAGEHFAAITDPGTSLVDVAEKTKFRKTFKNPETFGGRYSALSFFGLVPMALIGIDIKKLLNNARQMQISCGSFIPTESNPGVSLGAVLGMNARDGRDKATFILSSSIDAFGIWVEQLIAESTGKEGKGIIPIESEQLGKPEVYGNDRVFIYMHAGEDPRRDAKKLEALENAGHPVVKINLKDKLALGAEFLRWEIATATAGKVIGVNPFDQPNVAESKKNSKDFLKEWEENNSFTEGDSIVKGNGISIYANESADWLFEGKRNLDSFLNSYLKLAQPSDYFSLLAYFLKTPQRNKLLQTIRHSLRDSYKAATTLGYGPRYLHSTGQLHKGGPNSGIFILFTADAKQDAQIPDKDYGFATLQKAQALGDFGSLNNHKRRVIRIHLGDNIEQGLKTIAEKIK